MTKLCLISIKVSGARLHIEYNKCTKLQENPLPSVDKITTDRYVDSTTLVPSCRRMKLRTRDRKW